MFVHQFFLSVPLLDNYTYRLLIVRHAIQLYPADVTFEPCRTSTQCDSPEQFEQVLRSAFNDKLTKDVIKALMAQVREVNQPAE
jgi:hypothetical protein